MIYVDKLNLNAELREKLTVFFENNKHRIEALTSACRSKGFMTLSKESDLMRLAVCVNYLKYTYEDYKKLGINDKVFTDTISDISIWCENNGNKGLKNYNWLKNHLNCELFRIGRLQYQLFSVKGLKFDCGKLPLKKNEQVVYIHIPQGEKLDYNKCVDSLKNAVTFFNEFFPEFKFRYFFCESWLLFEDNMHFMKENSNILKFQTLFSIVGNRKDSSQAIERIFKKRRIFAKNYPENTSLQGSAKNYIINGGKLGIGVGIIEKDNLQNKTTESLN